jgi:serine/threonine-protein kinase
MKAIVRWWSGRSAPSQGSPPSPEALPAGFVLSDVTLERPMGRGTTAAVYAGSDLAAPGERRAVKVWAPRAGAGEATARQRFLDEARRTQLLDHPAIVRVLRSGTEHGLSCIVMPWFADTSLAPWVAAQRRLPEPLVFEIALQLADALGHAHRQGVLHRDVKPSNVLFQASSRRVALTDFGIARAPDAQASVSGVLIGSPVYMAPELLAGQRASAGSDLYALAVLCFELLTGRPPYDGNSMGSLLRAVAQAAPPPLATLRPDWTTGAADRIDAWFAAVLAKDPGHRPADAQAWARSARAASTESGLGCAYNDTNPP